MRRKPYCLPVLFFLCEVNFTIILNCHLVAILIPVVQPMNIDQVNLLVLWDRVAELNFSSVQSSDKKHLWFVLKLFTDLRICNTTFSGVNTSWATWAFGYLRKTNPLNKILIFSLETSHQRFSIDPQLRRSSIIPGDFDASTNRKISACRQYSAHS